MNEERCEVFQRKESALRTEICPLILWVVSALLHNDPLVLLNLLVWGVSVTVQTDVLDRAAGRSGAHK